jgi:hypothetical protein
MTWTPQPSSLNDIITALQEVKSNLYSLQKSYQRDIVIAYMQTEINSYTNLLKEDFLQEAICSESTSTP